MQIYHKPHRNYFFSKVVNLWLNRNQKFPWHIWESRQIEFYRLSENGEDFRFNVINLLNLKNDSIRVVDFGGGIGWAFFTFKRNFNVIEYTVIETKLTVSKFIYLNRFVDWSTELPLVSLSETDSLVFYSNSAIQYLSPRQRVRLFKHIKQAGYNYVVLEDIQLTDKSEFWAQQRYYEYSLLSHFTTEKLILRKFKELGYSCALNINTLNKFAENWEYEVNSDKFVISNPKSLVFKKI